MRIKYGVPLTKYDRSTFFTPEAGPHGYTDYPTATLSQLTDATPMVIPKNTVNSDTFVSVV